LVHLLPSLLALAALVDKLLAPLPQVKTALILYLEISQPSVAVERKTEDQPAVLVVGAKVLAHPTQVPQERQGKGMPVALAAVAMRQVTPPVVVAGQVRRLPQLQ
jgi:hypothetical protein